MSDTQIIELDDEPPEATEPWRAGSLTIVAAPIVLIVAVVSSLTIWGGASPDIVAKPFASEAPATVPPPMRTSATLVTTIPYASAASGETGDPEVLVAQRWNGLGPSYPSRGDVAEAVLHGAAYVIGGTGTIEDGRNVYRYDPRLGTRERVADLPISLDHAMAATLENRIYVFGGYVLGQTSARVFSLGANDQNWIEHSLMPAGRAAGGASVLNGRIWLVGGVGLNGSWISDIWSWDGRGRWSTGLARLPTPRDHLAVGTYLGKICAAGGNGGERAFECYWPVLNEWVKMPDLRKPIIGGRAAEAGGWFWVVGPDVHVFTADHWQFGPRPQTPRAGHALFQIDGGLYVVGGGIALGQVYMELLRPQP